MLIQINQTKSLHMKVNAFFNALDSPFIRQKEHRNYHGNYKKMVIFIVPTFTSNSILTLQYLCVQYPRNTFFSAMESPFIHQKEHTNIWH